MIEKSFEGEFLAYYDSNPTDDRGFGWFEDRLKDFHSSIDLDIGSTFRTTARTFDRSPTMVPPRHPLRAIDQIDCSDMRLFVDGSSGS
jgi:hypothetical protein